MAVFSELKKQDSDHELRFWCDRKFGPRAKEMVESFDPLIPVSFIAAGKFRRYHGESKWQQLAPSTLLPNIIDLFKIMGGFVQSFFKLLLWWPDVIFIKGGYVCLPVGYAARVLGIPLVLHDSDAHPGLTNRLLAPFAMQIGTGAPLEYYNYPPEKARYVGIPVGPDFRQYTLAEQRQLKVQLGFDPARPLIVVTGGGLGAVRINNAVAESLDALLAEASVYLISGNHQFDELSERLPERDGWRLEAFVHDGMAQVLAAADIVVARAGATTLLELAALAKPSIIIPNGRLTAGHQLKNAKVYKDALAAVVMSEEEIEQYPTALAAKVKQLLNAPKIRQGISKNFARFAKPQAATEMAQMIITAARRGARRRAS